MASSIMSTRSRTKSLATQPTELSMRSRDPRKIMATALRPARLAPNKKFTPLSVQLDNLPPLKQLRRSSRSSSPSTVKPTFKISKPRKTKNARFVEPTTGREMSPIDEAEVLGMEKRMRTFLPQGQALNITGGVEFFPKIAWGEREEVGKSVIQRADREIEIWEEVRRAHVEGLPGAVPFIDVKIGEAKKARAALEDCEDNHRVGKVNPGEFAIKQQIEALEWALEKSKYEPERDNIRGAIEGYKSGEIKFCDHFTILYAGKVVDTAKDYSSFVVDRQERLDRYYKAHGPHWLFYEAPLNIHPDTRATMMASSALPRAEAWSNLGPYHVQQGFWKRDGWVNRMPSMSQVFPSIYEPSYRKLRIPGVAEFFVDCQEVGPKQAFRSLLDSGATYPSLFAEDLRKLAIDDTMYACQAVQRLSTANGEVQSRIYEMSVCVLDNQNRQLVDPKDASYPTYDHHLGGLCPVTEMAGVPMYDENGLDTSMRLSGLLPFLACYISSAPTVNHLFLGEDRQDVLGLHRMPGRRRWDIGLDKTSSSYQADGLEDDRIGPPKTAFSHRGGQIIDEDHPIKSHSSTITVNKGTPTEYSWEWCPKEDPMLNKNRSEMLEKERVMQEHRANPAWASGRVMTQEERRIPADTSSPNVRALRRFLQGE